MGFMDDSLDGKVALVTGGGRRVGAAIARRLHAAGAKVLIHYRDSEADAAKLEGELNAQRARSAAKVKAELLAPVAPRALVGGALESFGRLDILVNNASAFFPVPVGGMEPSHWEELIGSNLRAPLFISQQAAPELAKNEGCDRQHRRHPRRAAAEGLRALQRRQGRARRGDARARARARAARARERRRARRDRLAGGRPVPGRGARAASSPPRRSRALGSPDDIARAVHFLACAPYVTGQILAVDGGRSIFI